MVRVSLPDATWVDDVGAVPGVEPCVWDPSLDPNPPGPVEVFVAPYLKGVPPIATAAALGSVQVVQLLTTGFDGVLEAVPPRVTVCNSGWVHNDSTAELAVTLALASQRGIPDAVRSAADGVWAPALLPSLADRRVLLIGYGGVGRAIAARLQPFAVRLTVLASRAREGDDLVDRVHGIEELDTLLSGAEVVVVAVPLIEATRGLIGERFLSLIGDGGLVVNVSRGPVADTPAMLRHAGRLRFGLDVTDPEPLPPDHPLWRAPGVLITPHIGGATSAFRPRAVAMLREQLTRIGRGEAPGNVVRLGVDRPGVGIA